MAEVDQGREVIFEDTETNRPTPKAKAKSKAAAAQPLSGKDSSQSLFTTRWKATEKSGHVAR